MQFRGAIVCATHVVSGVVEPEELARDRERVIPPTDALAT